jgi:hypothetical protein
MAYTFDWKLTSLKKQTNGGFENAIVGTQWIVTGTNENGYSGSFNGATPFKVSEINPDTYTSYNDLTEVDVLNWIKTTVSGSNQTTNYWEHILGRIEKQIEETATPIVTVLDEHFPWAPPSDTTGSRLPI